MALPTQVKYLIVGAGIHGLSTAYHLALQLKALGRGDGRDILIVDKGGIAAGASGIACGVVRNNYFQPAMRELMAHSVGVWETDPQGYSYHPVGYMQISPESMHADVATIAQQQKGIGYESTFVEGEQESTDYMKTLFHDWQAKGITSVLHEKRGGYANNTKAMYALATKAESEGVRAFSPAAPLPGSRANRLAARSGRSKPTGARSVANRSLSAPVRGSRLSGICSNYPKPSASRARMGLCTMTLQEGTLGVDPELQKTNDGRFPPVIHVDSNEPLYSDYDGSLITDQMWGIYYKPDFHFGGIQGGAAPYAIETDPDDVAVDPYGVDSPDFVVGEDFAHMWTSALAHCQKRFEGQFEYYTSGGIGSFTPDSFPVFDVFRENCYLIADSNHGYKMLGVGKLVAEELCGTTSALLEPFRFSRYEQGQLHPVSSSPFPWS